MFPRDFRLFLLLLVAPFVVGLALIYFNSRGDISTYQIKASNGDCIEVVQKSNGWDHDPIDLREC